MKPQFFATPADLKAWFDKNQGKAQELLVGFYKRDSGKPSITWPESVDEALCVGWIDGVRKRVDDESYTIRFTPRKPTSIWSAVNIKRVAALTSQGRMRPAGLEAFERRRENKSGIYSYEQRPEKLDEPYAEILGKNKVAQKFFESRPGSYRRAAIWWVVSAKKEETRLSRLQRLIELSAAEELIPQFMKREPVGKKPDSAKSSKKS